MKTFHIPLTDQEHRILRKAKRKLKCRTWKEYLMFTALKELNNSKNIGDCTTF